MSVGNGIRIGLRGFYVAVYLGIERESSCRINHGMAKDIMCFVLPARYQTGSQPTIQVQGCAMTLPNQRKLQPCLSASELFDPLKTYTARSIYSLKRTLLQMCCNLQHIHRILVLYMQLYGTPLFKKVPPGTSLSPPTADTSQLPHTKRIRILAKEVAAIATTRCL